MNCLEVSILLEALHDGALDSETMRSVEEHLSACTSCSAELVQLRIVSALLQRIRIPAPSENLDARLMIAFRQQHSQTSRQVTRWSRVFSGSVLVPKTALAMAVIIIVVVLVGAFKIGLMASGSPVGKVALPVPSPPNASGPRPAAPEIGIVEVPVIHERLRTVYVDSRRLTANQPRNKNISAAASDVAMSGSVGEKGYFTRVNLSGFLPSSEMKTRVISEVKPNEK